MRCYKLNDIIILNKKEDKKNKKEFKTNFRTKSLSSSQIQLQNRICWNQI